MAAVDLGPETASPRVVLCSSDPFGVPAMEALAARGWLAGLVTQPDRPRGRGRQIEPLLIKLRAQELEVPIQQPEKIGPSEAVADLRSLHPDYLVIASYAQYLPKVVREIPRKACLNIHPSLLPQYRGSSPVTAAIWYGDEETGVTIHYTEKGIDTGDLLGTVKHPILPGATGGLLKAELAELGATLLIETIEGLEEGILNRTVQDPTLATMTRLVTAGDRALDFTLPATELDQRIRALSPEPGSLLDVDGTPLKVLLSRALSTEDSSTLDSDAASGTVMQLGKSRVAIRCGEGWLELLEVQPAGKKPMPVAAWLNGMQGKLPARLESRPGDPRPLAVPIGEAHRLVAPVPHPAPGGADHG